MKIKFKRAIINFVLAYLVVTILAYGVSWLAEIVYELPVGCRPIHRKNTSMIKSPRMKLEEAGAWKVGPEPKLDRSLPTCSEFLIISKINLSEIIEY